MKILRIILLFACAFTPVFYSFAQDGWANIPRVEIYQRFELEITNHKPYNDPFRDVELLVEFVSPEGEKINHFGFYDGENIWRIRFSPNERGKWTYKAWFSDGSKNVEGAFGCIVSDKPGRVMKNEFNPFWLGKGGSSKTLFRSFHVGDRFFAENWDDAENPNDGELRMKFLDWLQENKYNMLSIASHYTNRDENSRGRFWDTPRLWPLDPEEYRKMEVILDELHERDITVFPFAGFFGASGTWPTAPAEQELYIKYTLARIGHYPNIILNVAGPEPFWREDRQQYQGAMRWTDIQRLGHLIDSLDTHNHILTVHNEKRATQYGDPFIDEPWCDMSTLQGPTTTNLEELFSGLAMNHRRSKPVYAQETLWAGNMYHPEYSNDQLRKNVLTILFSGSVLNFADMDGNSSSGFSGSLNLEDLNPDYHAIAGRVWDWFETIPFHQMTSRQDLVKQGFCLAKEGQEYYIYADTISKVELFLDFPYKLYSEWINAKNPADVRMGIKVNQKTVFNAPEDGDDWILHVFAPRPQIAATGNFPDLAVDNEGNIHLVYNRGGLKYKKYILETGSWSEEQEPGCNCINVSRSDPDVVVDSNGNPHVFCGTEYAFFDGKRWHSTEPGAKRDTELAIDQKDDIYLVSRGGNNGGFIGFKSKSRTSGWEALTDPDRQNKGSNNHVYSDIFVDQQNRIHLVQRHGPVMEVTYRRSDDGGKTWPVEEAVSDDRSEAPHIVADSEGNVVISTGKGYVYERDHPGNWKSHGRKIQGYSRKQPELGIDNQNNIYLTCFDGNYNTRLNGIWMGEKLIEPMDKNKKVGFVETAGIKDFAFVVWEEGIGNADEGLEENASIYVGMLYPDGRLVGLGNDKESDK